MKCSQPVPEGAVVVPAYTWFCSLLDDETISASDVNELGATLSSCLREKGIISSDIIFDDSSLLLSNDHLPLLDCIRQPTIDIICSFLVKMTKNKAISASCDLSWRRFILRFSNQKDAKKYQPYLHGIECQVAD